MNMPIKALCPVCGSTETRLSRWRSHDERVRNPAMHPFRCGACGERFLAPATGRAARRTWPILVAGAAALLVIAIVGAIVFALIGDDHPADTAASAALTAPSLDAAREGDLDAQFRIARATLLSPERSKEATREAVEWLRRAADGGHTGAMIHLGKLYKSGIGTPQNFELAARWLGEAARAGDAEGMVEFGRLHRGGIGVEQDSVAAYVWFNRAAAHMHMEGVQERDSIAIKLSPDELKRAQAMSLLEDAPGEGGGEDGTTTKARLVVPPAQAGDGS